MTEFDWLSGIRASLTETGFEDNNDDVVILNIDWTDEGERDTHLGTQQENAMTFHVVNWGVSEPHLQRSSSSITSAKNEKKNSTAIQHQPWWVGSRHPVWCSKIIIIQELKLAPSDSRGENHPKKKGAVLLQLLEEGHIYMTQLTSHSRSVNHTVNTELSLFNTPACIHLM